MAYKTFVNGYPLNASELNNYLMNQSVMVFSSATDRSTTLPAPVEGMISYLQDTNAFESYDGAAWVTLSTVPSQIAGKNKIINGAFDFWQRGTSFSNPGVFTYTADRWMSIVNGTPTLTVTRQTFTPGSAPVAGYEGSYFLRQNVTAVSSSTVIALGQKIEDVRTFAGQTVTLSFWAKADAARTWTLRLDQDFGSGGSTTVSMTEQTISVTTSWQRFTLTFAVASISGKTIGTSSNLQVLIFGPANTVQTMDIWGVQLEAGSVATPFSRAAGTLQGELAACQRYFYDPLFNTTAANRAICNANAYSTTAAFGLLNFPTSMRVAPSINSTASSFALGYAGGATLTSMLIETSQPDSILLLLQVASGLTTNASYHLYRPGTSATLQFSAEL